MADKLSYLKAGMAVKACRIIISFCGEKIYARGLSCEMHHKFADTAALKLFFDGDAYDFSSIIWNFFKRDDSGKLSIMAAGKYGTLLLCGNFRDLLLIFLKRCLEHTLRVYGTGFGSHQPKIIFYIFDIHCLSANRHYYCILPGNITSFAGVYNWTLQVFCKMPARGLGQIKRRSRN